MTIQECTGELMARLSYTLGAINGGFEGVVRNEDFPLSPADRWTEESGDDRRTWNYDGHTFHLRPYTLGDLRLVMHCGTPVVECGGATIVMSIGRDGFQVRGEVPKAEALIRNYFSEINVPLVHDEGLFDYISPDGTLTY